MKLILILSILAASACSELSTIQSDVVAITPAAQQAIDLGLEVSGNAGAAALNDALIAPVIKASEPGVTQIIDNAQKGK